PLAERERRRGGEQRDGVAERVVPDFRGERQQDEQEGRQQRRPLVEQRPSEGEEGDHEQARRQRRDDLGGDPPGVRTFGGETRNQRLGQRNQSRVERVLVRASDDRVPRLGAERPGEAKELQAVLRRHERAGDARGVKDRGQRNDPGQPTAG